MEDLGPPELAVGKRSENHLQIVGKSMDFRVKKHMESGDLKSPRSIAG
jgi:hypothetical protein